MRLQRANLIDPAAPNPSVEALLHAFIPHKFVDHTHSTAVLALTDQPDGEALCREVYGARVGYVPYLMPGFGLAKAAAQVFEADPSVEGLILVKHGIFSFGADARQAYERMIALVTLAEQRLAKNRKPAFVSARLPARPARVADVAPIVRGACSLPDGKTDGAWKRFVLDFRGNDAVMNFVNGAEVARYGQAGVVTPDHNIRIKNCPLVVAAPADGELADFKEQVRGAVAAYGERYQDYFARNNARVGGIKTMLDPAPRVVLVPGVGLFGLGRSKKDARVAADLAEAAIATITDAEAVGRFEPLPEADLFDVEYWSLEQAKLGNARELPLAGQVAVITGAAGLDRLRDRQGIRGGRRRSGAAGYRRGCRAGESQGDRRRGAWAFDATSPTPHRCGTRSRQSRPRSAGSISRCRMPAPPGRAGSARSTKRCCGRALS